MKRLMLTIVVGMGLFALVGCSPSLSYITIPVTGTTETTATTDTLPTTQTTGLISTTTDSPTSIVIRTKDDLAKVGSDLTYPCAIMFSNYIAGVGYSSWLRDDNTAVLGHNSGDVMALRIYNDHDEPCVFSIKYDSSFLSPTTYSETGDTVYSAPPLGAENWVNIKYPEITILPHELTTVPFSFKAPVNTVLPDNWEFRIVVTNETYANMIIANGAVRVLVTTQK